MIFESRQKKQELANQARVVGRFISYTSFNDDITRLRWTLHQSGLFFSLEMNIRVGKLTSGSQQFTDAHTATD